MISPDFALSAALGLRALGNVDAEPLEKGIHLRWGFHPELGYARPWLPALSAARPQETRTALH
jgi:hypothetical protein